MQKTSLKASLKTSRLAFAPLANALHLRTHLLGWFGFISATVLLLAVASGCAPKTTKTPSLTNSPSNNMTTAATQAAPNTAPSWIQRANIYEVNVRQYTPEGTFKAFEKHLPRLKAMGVDVLWLMPIQPIGKKNRKGSLGSYYAVQDYKGVNPEFGNLDDFKHLVKAAHEQGMHLIIDWVANHTAWDNVWIDKHPDWYTQKDGKIVAPVDDWTDVADLNYDNKAMRKAMVDALEYWVREADIDGYRCDVAMMVPMDFWEQDVRAHLDKAVKPLFWLCEAEGPEFHKAAFHASYAWDAHHLFNDIAQGKKNAHELDGFLAREREKYPTNALRMQFTSNHDENTWNGTEYERMGDAAQVFAVLAATFNGIPLVYSGQEAKLDHRLKFFDKDEIKWNNTPLADFYRRLLTLKHDNKALENAPAAGSFTKVKTEADDAVYAFVREKDHNRVLVVLNLSAQAHDVHLSSAAVAGKWNDVFGTAAAPVEFKEGNAFHLAAWSYHVYTAK